MLNPSTGQSKVISLSYIAGLNKSSNYAAPIIIDNPLGLFSDEHREAITSYLPHFGKQIIFMVSSGDLTDKYRQIIAPYVKTEYYLDNTGDSTWPKTTILFGKGILGYKDCQRAGTEQGDHISRAAEEYQPRQISSKHRGGPVSEAPEEMPEEKTAGGRGTAGVRPG